MRAYDESKALNILNNYYAHATYIADFICNTLKFKITYYHIRYMNNYGCYCV